MEIPIHRTIYPRSHLAAEFIRSDRQGVQISVIKEQVGAKQMEDWTQWDAAPLWCLLSVWVWAVGSGAWYSFALLCGIHTHTPSLLSLFFPLLLLLLPPWGFMAPLWSSRRPEKFPTFSPPPCTTLGPRWFGNVLFTLICRRVDINVLFRTNQREYPRSRGEVHP